MKRFYAIFFVCTALFLAVCGSAWGDTYTVASDASSCYSAQVPVYPTYTDETGTKSQIIYSKDSLTALAGSNITALRYYTNKNITWSSTGTVPTLTVRMKEVDLTTLSGFQTGLTEVYTGQPAGKGTKEMYMEFSSSFTYSGTKNLLIEVEVTTGGGYQSDLTFYNKNLGNGNIGYWHYHSSNGNTPAMPKTTFYYEEPAGDCAKPTSISVPNATTTGNSATVTWEGENNTTLEYKLNSAADLPANWTVVSSTTTSTSHNLTELTPITKYNVRVKNDCGEDGESAYRSTSFTTACGAITTLPWSEGFEDMEVGNYASVRPGPCWEKIGAVQADSYSYPQIYVNNSSTYVKTGSKSLYFVSSNSTDSYVILPEFDEPLNALQISFAHISESTSSSAILTIGYITDVNNASTFHALGSALTRSTEWATITKQLYDVPCDVASSARIAIKAGKSSTSNYYTGVDDIVVSLASKTCTAPTVSSVSEKTATSAKFTWGQKNGVTLYQYCVVASGDEPDWSGNLTASCNSVTVSGLTASTDYDFYVRCVCGVGEYSTESDAYSFSTTAACPTPGLMLFDRTYNSATVTWQKGGDETSWNLRYKPVGGSWSDDDGAASGLTSCSYTIEDLTPGVYTVQVQAGCQPDWTTGYVQANCTITCPTPGAITLSNQKYDRVTVGWAAGGTEDHWNLRYKETAAADIPANWTTVATNTTTRSGHVISGLTAGTSYTIEVSTACCSAAGVSSTTYTPVCPQPGAITLSGQTYKGVIVSWAAGGTEDSWNVRYKETAADDIPANWTNVASATTNRTCTIASGLTAGVEYTIEVTAACCAGGAARTTTYTPSCAQPGAITLSNKTYNGVTVAWAASGTLDHWNLQYKLKAAEDVPANWTDVAMNTTSRSGHTISGLTTNTAYTIRVTAEGCDADPRDIDYTPICAMPSVLSVLNIRDATASATWTSMSAEGAIGYQYSCVVSGNSPSWSATTGAGVYNTSFNSLTVATTYTAAVRAVYPGGLYSDAKTKDFTTVAQAPTSLTKSDITSEGATFSWSQSTYGMETRYQWKVGTGAWSDPLAANVRTVTVTGLSPNTAYTFYVRSYYNETVQSSAISTNFTTDCADNALPWEYDFEDDATGSGKIPDCWKAKTYTSGSVYPYVYGSSAHSGSKCVYFYGGSSLSPQSIVLPKFDRDLKDLTLSFYYNNTSTDDDYASFQIGYYATDGDPSTAFTAVAEVPRDDGYVLGEVDLKDFPTTKKRLVISYSNGSLGGHSAYIDDISLEVTPTCKRPMELTCTSVSSSTATLSWTARSGETSWQIEYADNAEFTGSTVVDANSNPFTLTDLAPTTTYYARVRAVCSALDMSGWCAIPVSFTTLCVEETLPYYENFNCLTAGIPECWDNSEGTTTTDSYKWNYYASGATGACVRFNSYSNGNGKTNFLKTRTIALPASTAATLTFQYKNGAGGNMTVYYSFDGGTTTTQLANLSTQASWATKTYTIPSQGTAKNVTIIFKGTSNYGSGDAYLYVDDVRLTASSCADNCTGLSSSSVGGNSAVLSWTSSASEWTLRYRSNCGDWTEVDNITSKPYTLNGLDAGTNYEVQVKSVCSAGSEGAWSNSATFTTTCDGVINAIESHFGFEGLSDGAIPGCWTRTPDNTYVGAYSTYAHTGSKSLRFYGGYTARTIILPEFAIPFRDLKISLYCKIDYANADYGKLQIGYINSSGTFVSKKTYTPTTSFVEVEYEYPSEGYADTPKKIALQFSGGNSSYDNRYLSVDDITVTIKPCTKPTANEPSEVSYTSATITWTDTRAEEWSVRYKKTADEDIDENWTEVNDLDSKSYTMTGLDLNTEYEVQVRNDCYAESSPWTDSETFTTLNPVAQVSVGGVFDSYHMTVDDAITRANGLTNPTVSMMRNASVDSEVTITAAMTIDLNGDTISSTEATADKGVFKVNASGETVTIKDSGEGGKIDHTANGSGYINGIVLVAGSLNIEGGTIYAENTNTSTTSTYRANGIYYKTNTTASITMSGGTVIGKRNKNYAYGMYIYRTSTPNCNLTITGGEVRASGTNYVRGIYTQGTAELSNVTVNASASGSDNCYAVFSDSKGSFTINSGTYTASCSGSGAAYPLAITAASASATINGGRFNGKSQEVYVSGGTASLQGGVYVHNTSLATNCAPYYVVDALTSGDDYDAGYRYQVVQDLTNTFTDATEDHAWGTAGNWSKGVLPRIDVDVTIEKPCEVDITDARAKSIVLDQNGNTGKLTVEAGKELVVAESIRKTTNGENRLATGENDIVIGSTSGAGLGALVMGEHDGTNNATVYFATLSHGTSGSTASVCQYVGTPFCNNPAMLYQFYNSWMYKLNATGDNWIRVNGGDGLVAFDGYAVISADPAGHVFDMSGTLCSSDDVTNKALNYNGSSNTENMLANSWMAPIKIHEFNASTDFTNAEATIYIFNSGSQDDYDTNNGASSFGNEPGQYATYTPGTAEETDVIPAMQSFSVYATGSGAKISLDYSRLVYDPAIGGTTPVANRVQRRAASTDPMTLMSIRVTGSQGWADAVRIYMREDFEQGFENGWDGRKMFGETAAPQLYALTPDGKMTINCIPTFEGAVLGFHAGAEDNAYTFSFQYDGDETLYLNDLKEEKSTLISSENTYQFFTADGDLEARFIISATPYGAPEIATGTVSGEGLEVSGARKVIIDNKLYIIRSGRMYDATGKAAK